MKKVKLVVLLVILAFIAFIGFQNSGFILVKHQFGVNLGFTSYQTPEIQNGILLLGFFLAGLMLAFISTLRGRWQARRTIKGLTGEVAASNEKIATLEKELLDLKADRQIPESVDQTAGVSS